MLAAVEQAAADGLAVHGGGVGAAAHRLSEEEATRGSYCERPHWQGRVMMAEQGAQGPGWQRLLQGCVQAAPRLRPQTFPQL